ncbi:hypothetical protein AB4407_06625, partial [Vibrio sp. 10N.261.46.E11]|uniref:hypothetical protein n=1 Tax=Vibrio sp. 10N.261.46.E11 TaxID=3229662 RepID=UPI00354F7E3A
EAKASEAEARISTMLQSSSWRITTLFKWFALQLKLLRVMGVKARFKSLLVKVIGIVVSKSITFITTRPKLKNFCIQLARKLGVDARLRAFQQNPSPKNITPKIHSVDSGELTPYAKDIYLQLQSTIEAESRRKG